MISHGIAYSYKVVSPAAALALAVAVAVAIVACGGDSGQGPPPDDGTFTWNLPAGFPMPNVPDDNPMTSSKVALGRRLFYDRRLSVTGNFSCASCHQQSRAFTDGRAFGKGATGEEHPRNSMSLANVAYASAINWADPTIPSLEEQAVHPLFGDQPVEHGLGGNEAGLLAMLRGDSSYRRLFPASFPGAADAVSVPNVLKALGAFQRTLISGNSPYDRYAYQGQTEAISDEAKTGLALFRSERLKCAHCHDDFNFTTAATYVGKTGTDTQYFNTGLYNLNGTGDYRPPNFGLKEFTGLAADMGRFKPPTLRNIAVTGPYMHDGSISSLDEVLDHYAAGGRTIANGFDAGVGSENPYKSDAVTGFTLAPSERVALLAFLRSLTDSSFLADPRFANPWPPGGP